MAQRSAGIWKIFSNPIVYQFIQNFLGGKTRELFVDHYIKAKSSNLLLDIGCGTGEIIKYLPDDINYIGIDFSSEYIKFAMQRMCRNAHFICGDINNFDYHKFGKPDIVLAEGVLHHLSDNEASILFAKLVSVMGESGRLITIDPCFTSNQNLFAKFIINLDRGKNVRTCDEYYSLAKPFYSSVRCHIRSDLLIIPYNHCIMECRVNI